VSLPRGGVGNNRKRNDQSIINKMMDSIRPDALASLLSKGEPRNGSRPGKGERQIRDLTCGRNSERGFQECIGWVEIEWLEVGAT
jgi:hypothetical protein